METSVSPCKKDMLEKMSDLKCDIKYIDPTYM
jgi:hypothetical protein